MTDDRRAELMPLPPLETWWPYLTSRSREAIRMALDAPLGPRVRTEIERVVGHRVDHGARLTSDDRRFFEFADRADL